MSDEKAKELVLFNTYVIGTPSFNKVVPTILALFDFVKKTNSKEPGRITTLTTLSTINYTPYYRVEVIKSDCGDGDYDIYHMHYDNNELVKVQTFSTYLHLIVEEKMHG